MEREIHQTNNNYNGDHTSSSSTKSELTDADIEAAKKGDKAIGLKLNTSRVLRLLKDTALNINFMSIEMGNIKEKARCDGNLIFKFSFKKKNMGWEDLTNPTLFIKVTYPWSDIVTMKSTILDDDKACLLIKLAKKPECFTAPPPPPKKHIDWKKAEIEPIVQSAASSYAHKLVFQRSLLEKHLEQFMRAHPKNNVGKVEVSQEFKPFASTTNDLHYEDHVPQATQFEEGILPCCSNISNHTDNFLRRSLSPKVHPQSSTFCQFQNQNNIGLNHEQPHGVLDFANHQSYITTAILDFANHQSDITTAIPDFANHQSNITTAIPADFSNINQAIINHHPVMNPSLARVQQEEIDYCITRQLLSNGNEGSIDQRQPRDIRAYNHHGSVSQMTMSQLPLVVRDVQGYQLRDVIPMSICNNDALTEWQQHIGNNYEGSTYNPESVDLGVPWLPMSSNVASEAVGHEQQQFNDNGYEGGMCQSRDLQGYYQQQTGELRNRHYQGSVQQRPACGFGVTL